MGKHVVITEAEAERSFPELLRAAKAGQRVTITDGDRPVAELGPAAEESGSPEEDEARKLDRERAWQEMEKRWAESKPIVISPWTRDELYERD